MNECVRPAPSQQPTHPPTHPPTRPPTHPPTYRLVVGMKALPGGLYIIVRTATRLPPFEEAGCGE